MPAYRLAIFDYDGTLADSARAIVNTMRTACAAVGQGDVDATPLADWIGLPLPAMVDLLWQNSHADPTLRPQVITQFRERYPALCREHTRLYPGMAEVLRAARAAGIVLAIATSKAESSLQSSMESLQIAGYFQTWRTADRVQNVKPHPESIVSILEELGLQPHQAVMIGDTIYDMEMGRRAGVDTIAVTYGMHDVERLQPLNPTHWVHAPRGLMTVLGLSAAA